MCSCQSVLIAGRLAALKCLLLVEAYRGHPVEGHAGIPSSPWLLNRLTLLRFDPCVVCNVACDANLGLLATSGTCLGRIAKILFSQRDIKPSCTSLRMAASGIPAGGPAGVLFVWTILRIRIVFHPRFLFLRISKWKNITLRVSFVALSIACLTRSQQRVHSLETKLLTAWLCTLLSKGVQSCGALTGSVVAVPGL